jgi:hypothetical protein
MTMAEEGFLGHPNVQEVMKEEQLDATHVTDLADGAKQMTDKMLHLLKIFPRISPSMMQVGLGPATPPKFWRPILETLIQEGKIKRETEQYESPNGRTQSYTILCLAPAQA